MNTEDLKPPYYIFGNKGNVWADNCHIGKTGNYTTLCGIPMLSNNWARLEKVKNIGCPQCLNKHKNETEIHQPKIS